MFFEVPTEEEMEQLLAKAKKPPKVKPPCKWGPRDENGFCPGKPAAEASGNGASSSARPCKYGPRDADGNCPPKPAAARAPCKWGPRGSDGTCPKKPKKSFAERTAERTASAVGRSVGGAAADVGWEAATNPEFRNAIKTSVANGLKTLGTGVLGFVTSAGALATAAALAVGIARLKATEALNMKRNLERDPYWPQKQHLTNQAIEIWENAMGRKATPVEKSRIMRGVWPDHPAFALRPDIRPMGEG